ncbi:hypothetical protein MRB56_14210 [Halomonas cupida]|uniref:hypothetical protein n=1 Tax=Halomonas cupida TaxID=44933 RepID=UPI0039B4A7BB
MVLNTPWPDYLRLVDQARRAGYVLTRASTPEQAFEQGGCYRLLEQTGEGQSIRCVSDSLEVIEDHLLALGPQRRERQPRRR